MKFLHTSDWHLGKTFYGLSLIDDQEHFLCQVKSTLEADDYDALIVSGDIYDRAIPSPEAVKLLSKFLSDLHFSLPNLHIFMIAGNHDSADRLSFAASLLEDKNIHICTNVLDLCKPVIVGSNSKVAIYQIPFLTPGMFTSEDGEILRTQQQLVQQACSQIVDFHKKNYSELPCILSAHLFALGSAVSDSERSNIGTLEQVDANLFSEFTYTALGHIHKSQKVGKNRNAFYSGSPLPYSFDDLPNTKMLSVEIVENKVEKIEEISIKLLHNVVRLEGSFDSFYGSNCNKELITEHKNDYIEIICTDNTTIENPIALLKTNFTNILSFRKKDFITKSNTSLEEERKKVMLSKSESKPEELFSLFMNDVYGSNFPSDQLVKQEKEIFISNSKELSWIE